MGTLPAKFVLLAILLGAVAGAYAFVARPYQLHWGATEEEIARAMPGDELHGAPTFLATRAITIEAGPDAIWPWLIQMGWGRGGFYAYDVIENLGSPRGIRSADRILPEYQQLRAGDEVPISAVHSMVFHRIERGRLVVWAGTAPEAPGAFAWVLYPEGPGRTRLVSRIGWTHRWTSPATLPLELFTELADHVAVRRVLRGVKDRAEGRTEPFFVHVLELAVYVLALLTALAAGAGLLLRPLRGRTVVCALGAGLAWLVVWYAPLPTAGAAAVALASAAGTGWGISGGRRPRR